MVFNFVWFSKSSVLDDKFGRCLFLGKLLTAKVDYVDTWVAMEKLLDSGRVRSLGISNFNAQQIERVLAVAKIVPVTNQVRCNPRTNERALIKFCNERNITLTAHTPLGRPKNETDGGLLSDPKVLALAQKHDRTAAQIILRYTVQNGGIVIPKSTKKQHLADNLNLFDFQLSDNDMEILHSLNEN